MMPSLYTGVSGIKNHQTRMDVVGNNVANVNTVGFKKSRVNFKDIISMNLQGPSRPNEDRGGINGQQVGLGMTIASIDTLHTPGTLSATGRSLDAAIQGDGYFIFRNGDDVSYGRAGMFGIDKDNNLTQLANGFHVQGWRADLRPDGSSRIVTSTPIEDLKIPVGEKFPAKTTENIAIKSNLNAAAPIIEDPLNPTNAEYDAGSFHSTSINVFDTQGVKHELSLDFMKVAENTWRVSGNVASETSIPGTVRISINDEYQLPADNATSLVTFTNQGSIESVMTDGDNPNVVADGNLSLYISYAISDGTPGGALMPPVRLDLGEVGQYNGITQISGDSTTKFREQDGFGMGYLSNFSIDDKGIITGAYTNGQSRELGQIALATFTNPSGLEKVGDTNFAITNNSGVANTGEANTENRGVVRAGTLEMANVNLADEFTDMIVTQRGFQANARTITTSDEILRDLLGLKR